jgi:hypothetical protein
MRKGDRVEFQMKGTTKYGVVLKGGKGKNTIILDGGERQVTGPSSALLKSAHPLPADEPSVMDKYSIIKYKDTGYGEETAQFGAEIVLDGKVVLYVRNTGQGGCNMYQRNPKNPIDGIQKQFEADAEKWGKQFGYPYDFEAEDTWVEWAGREKIYGKLAVDYFKGY